VASRKKKVVTDDDSGYWVYMEVAKDCKGFNIEVQAKEPMTSEEIIVVIEQWLNDNLLKGFENTKGPMQ
jgi:hypothetical protein